MRLPFAPFAVIASLALAGCSQPAQLYVDQAWVSASANPQSPSAGYFVIHGGEQAVELRGVTTDYAVRVEMHESMTQNGMMTMKPLAAAPVSAKSEVSFAPGGKHLMIFGLNSAAVSAGKLPLTFLFSNGDRIQVDAKVQKAGTPPSARDGSAMKHENH